MERVQENRRGGKGSFALLGEELSWQEGSFLPCPLSVPPLYYLFCLPLCLLPVPCLLALLCLPAVPACCLALCHW